MARRNRNDRLTLNRNKSSNWLINFRIPEEYQSHPLFVGKKAGDLFQKSTRETDYRRAVLVRDRFFSDHQLFMAEWTPQEAYATTYTGDFTPDVHLHEELVGQIIETELDSTSRNTVAHAILEGLHNKDLALTNPLKTPKSRFGISLKHAAKQYREYRADLPHKTLAKLDKAVERFLAFVKREDVSLEELRSQHVFKFLSHSAKELDMSRSTMQNDLSYLGKAFDLAQKQGLLNDQIKNPFRDQVIPPSTVKPKERQAMPIEHARGLYKACKTSDQKLLIAISHYCGTRIAETFQAKLYFEETKGLYLSIAEDGSGKTASATRLIPVSKGLESVLKKLGIESRPEKPLHLPWKVKTLSGLDKAFRNLKAPYFESLDIEHHLILTDHSFRHAFATYTANKYGELSAANLTGHKGSDRAFTELVKRYFHGTPWEHKQEVIEAIPSIEI